MRKLAGHGNWGAAALAVVALAMAVGRARGDTAYAWGRNIWGELGIGTIPLYSTTPVPVSVLTGGVTALASGEQHSSAIQNGAVYSWGNAFYGQIGNGTNTDSYVPVATNLLTSGVTAIAAGDEHCLALRNGAAYAWGWNNRGQLGNGLVPDSNVPVAVVGMGSGVSAIAAGYTHSLAVQNGAAYAWGDNAYGQLGNGISDPTRHPTPAAVTGLTSGVTAVAGGFEQSLAIQNGAVYAWGRNTAGQLGNGTTTDSYVPIAVTSMTSGVSGIAAGWRHELAIQNGVVYAWGNNSYGELGIGTTANSYVPVVVPGLPSDIVEVAAGYSSSFALSAEGNLWAWGNNGYGMLGLGNFTNYSTPQPVSAPAGYRFTSIDTSEESLYAVATVAPAPEPASLGWLLAGGAAVLRRRRKG